MCDQSLNISDNGFYHLILNPFIEKQMNQKFDNSVEFKFLHFVYILDLSYETIMSTKYRKTYFAIHLTFHIDIGINDWFVYHLL